MVENLIDEHAEDEVMEILDGIAKSAYTRGYLAGQEAVRKTYKSQSKMVPVKSPNQQRAELIQRAREFVEEHGDDFNFVVSEEEERFVYACKLVFGGKEVIVVSGKAVCHPYEVFNEYIGKAIAIARALEIDVPQEFLQAVQPTEVVVGMKIGMICSLGYPYAREIKSVVDETVEYTSGGFDYINIFRNNGKITDDTNAIYKEESH